MLNVLLSLRNPSPEGIRLCMYYGVCAALIAIGLIVIAARKRKQKKQLRAETVKKYCLKAKAHAEKALALQEHKNKNIQAMLGSTKLLALSNHVAEAAWYAFQIAEMKGDIIFSGLANELDGLASALAKESEMGYIPAADFEKQTKKAIDGLNTVVDKLNVLIAEKAKTK